MSALIVALVILAAVALWVDTKVLSEPVLLPRLKKFWEQLKAE